MDFYQLLDQLRVEYQEAKGLHQENDHSPFKIAKGKIGTLAEVIWAILELDLITWVDENGNERPITNKEDAVDIISKLLFGEPIKKWDQTIRAAFRRDNAMEIFDKMRNVAQDKKDKIRDC